MLIGSGGTGAQGPGEAEAVDFDGTNDYLSRASDFTGNAGSKTFTFSCWVYIDKQDNHFMVDTFKDSLGLGTLQLNVSGNDTFQITGRSSSGTNILIVAAGAGPDIPRKTLVHVLCSVDMTSSSKRHIYISDALGTATWSTYTDDFIGMISDDWFIGGRNTGPKYTGRLAHVYLDHTYRDLSIEANRRLFTEFGGQGLVPVSEPSLAALNPIMYFPMTDPETAHTNLGTGGNMVLNGVIARSGRGPNQYNAAASEIDGSNFLTYSDSAANGTLSYWAKNSGRTEHQYSTGAVSLTNITSALGDVVSDVYLSQDIVAEGEFIDDDGLPKYLGETGEVPSGSQPGTYFKMRADYPEINSGSGADATPTGAPFAGARGPSEYWARTAVTDVSNFLSNAGIFCKSLVQVKDNVVSFLNDTTVTTLNDGTYGHMFGTSEDITWTEDRMLEYVDAFGFPLPLEADGNTVLLLDFADTGNFGLNKGTGADYAETGTVTIGPDVLG